MVLIDLDRFRLVQDVIKRLPKLGDSGILLKQMVEDRLIEHKQYIDWHGQHISEIRNWKWSNSEGAIQIVVRHFRIEKEIIFIYG